MKRHHAIGWIVRLYLILYSNHSNLLLTQGAAASEFDQVQFETDPGHRLEATSYKHLSPVRSKVACALLCQNCTTCPAANYYDADGTCELVPSVGSVIETVELIGWTLIKKGYCEQGWHRLGLSCYHVHIDQLSHKQSESTCRWLGGELATVDTPEKMEFLEQLLPVVAYSHYYFWIRLHWDDVEQQWQWYENHPMVYQNWNMGEPNDQFGNPENCVILSAPEFKFRWWDVQCAEYTVNAICEKGLVF